MTTWQGDVPDPWPGDRQDPPSAADGAGHCEGRDHLLEMADLVGLVEADLAPEVPQDELNARSRLAADQLLVDAVLQQGLDGSRHQMLNTMLISYAVPVLKHLLQTGEIVAKCAKLGRWRDDSDGLLELTEGDRDELAQEMVADALPVFTTAVFVDRRWSPERGASLKTYFVNACALQFPTLYRRWWRHRRSVRPMGLLLDPDRLGGAADPAVQVAIADEAHRLLHEIEDEQMREVVLWRSFGYSASKAAEKAGLSSKAAEGRMARIRKNIQKRNGWPSQNGDVERREGRRFP